jgi:hypothetical protein
MPGTPGARQVSQERLTGPPLSAHLAVRQSMIRKSGYRFSLATNAERVCAEIMLKQNDRAG